MPIDLRSKTSGGSFVNQQSPINSTDQIYDEGSGKLWLRSGVIETDPLVYPDAYRNYFDATIREAFRYQDLLLISSNLIPSNTSVYIAVDADYVWVHNTSNDTVYQFDKLLKYTGFSFSHAYTSSFGIASDGSNLYICDTLSNTIKRFGFDGVEFGTPIDLSLATSTNIRSIEFDNNDGLLVHSLSGGALLERFIISTGAYDGVVVNTSPQSITVKKAFCDSEFYWIESTSSVGLLYKYELNGSFSEVTKKLPLVDDILVNSYGDMCFDFSNQKLLISNDNTQYPILSEDSLFITNYKNDAGYESISLGLTNPRGIGKRGSQYFITDLASSSVTEYNSDFTLSGFSFSTAAQDPLPRAVVPVSNGYYVLGTTTNKIYFYNLLGDYTGGGDDVDISSFTSEPRSLAFDGDCFYVVDWNTANMLCVAISGELNYKFDLSKQDSRCTGGFLDGQTLWVIGVTTKYMYNYTLSGSPTGKKVSLNESQNNIISGLIDDGVITTLSSDANIDMADITEGVGIPAYVTDADTGLPIYLRVK